MTGFQRTIANLGGAAGLAAAVLAITDLGEAGLVMALAGLVLAAVGLRHHAKRDYAGALPQARLDLWGKSRRHLEEALGEGAGALAILGVHLHGWDGLFSAALAEAHLFLHPTSYDSFSLACLEAAARGVPVVTTAGAGVAPLLPELLVATAPREEPGPAARVAAALLERHAAASAAERDAATAQVAADFDLDHHVIRLWELFDAQIGAVRD